jgi:hypothetical protein
MTLWRRRWREPQAGVIFDQAGNLYGTAALGGIRGNGIVYSLIPDGAALGPSQVCTSLMGPPDGSGARESAGHLFFRHTVGTTLRVACGIWGAVGFSEGPPQNDGDP